MHETTGRCHCGNIQINMVLTRTLDTYTPRTCDCDYCRKHGASYVSDAHGSVAIRITNKDEVRKYRQGSGLAEFVLCRDCGVLVGVICIYDGRRYAAINANVVDAWESFGTKQIVTPKTLPASEKIKRWQEIWFSNVDLVSVD